jgi:5-methylcytosine-specific restriction endonuclease McrA
MMTIGKLYTYQNNINFNPPYQRKAGVWNKSKKALLVDSVLNGYDIPKLYLHVQAEGEPFKWAVVDGKQRISALLEFMVDGYPLDRDFVYTGPALPNGANPPRRGQLWSELADEVKEIFKAYSIATTEISSAKREEIERLFIRLNDGVKLNDAEYRQGLGGRVIELIDEVEIHPLFKSKAGFKDDRFDFKEVSCRILVAESLLSKNKNITALKKKVLDDFVIDNREITDEEAQKLLTSVKKVLDFMAPCFSNNSKELTKSTTQLYYLWLRDIRLAYAHQNLQSKILKFVEDFASARIIDAKKDENKQDDLLKQFKWLSGQNTNGGESMLERCHILTKKFLEANPDVVPKDTKRTFNEDEKFVLWIRADKKCQSCGLALDDYKIFHADHIVPHSQGGMTTLENGQALCASCNLKKGAANQ